jgi:hypothetical protein
LSSKAVGIWMRRTVFHLQGVRWLALGLDGGDRGMASVGVF